MDRRTERTKQIPQNGTAPLLLLLLQFYLGDIVWKVTLWPTLNRRKVDGSINSKILNSPMCFCYANFKSLSSFYNLFVQNHPFGLQMPFFIDWQDSVHPCTDLVPSGTLKRLIVRLDHNLDRYRKFVSDLGLPLSLESGAPGLTADIEPPGGPAQL